MAAVIGPDAASRTLTAVLLASPLDVDVAPVSNSCFARAAEPLYHDTEAPPPPFVGAFTIPSHAMTTTPAEITPPRIAGKLTQLFPQVTVHWVTCGSHLVPVERGFLLADETDRSYWQFHPERGRCWCDPEDAAAGWLGRAGFPFILTSQVENESYYGLATFLYNAHGISALRYQVVRKGR